jgi:hypothetical protein
LGDASPTLTKEQAIGEHEEHEGRDGETGDPQPGLQPGGELSRRERSRIGAERVDCVLGAEMVKQTKPAVHADEPTHDVLWAPGDN